MNRLCRLLAVGMIVLEVSTASGQATIAGHSVDQYGEQLDSEHRVVRLRAVHSLGAFGQRAAKPLLRALQHDDAAVRYVAARRLGLIGGDALGEALPRLLELADDRQSLAVRLAASFALCRAGRTDKHLDLLMESLQYPERGMACSAAELIGEIGPPAFDAQTALATVVENNGAVGGRRDNHLKGAAMNALRKLRQTNGAEVQHD